MNQCIYVPWQTKSYSMNWYLSIYLKNCFEKVSNFGLLASSGTSVELTPQTLSESLSDPWALRTRAGVGAMTVVVWARVVRVGLVMSSVTSWTAVTSVRSVPLRDVVGLVVLVGVFVVALVVHLMVLRMAHDHVEVGHEDDVPEGGWVKELHCKRLWKRLIMMPGLFQYLYPWKKR